MRHVPSGLTFCCGFRLGFFQNATRLCHQLVEQRFRSGIGFVFAYSVGEGGSMAGPPWAGSFGELAEETQGSPTRNGAGAGTGIIC